MPVERSSTLDEILDRGSLRIPIEFLGHPDTGDPPEMYRDPESGAPDGLAPKVGAMIASDLGVELEIVEILWPDQIPALFDRKVDLLPKHTLFPRRALGGVRDGSPHADTGYVSGTGREGQRGDQVTESRGSPDWCMAWIEQ